MHICKKTNREFKSKRGLINHLRFVYKNYSMEEIYKQEIGEDNKNKCVICGKPTKFISFNKGFHKNWCGEEKCKKEIQLINNKKIGKVKTENKNKNKDMLNYILNNLDFYKENRYETNVFEPYTKKYTKGLTLAKYIGRLVDVRKIDYCVYCNKKINSTIYEKNCICHSCIGKSVNNFGYKNLNKRKLANCIFIMEKRGYTKNEILKIWRPICIYPIYSIYKKSGYNVEKYFKCKETGYFIPIKNKTSVLINHLKKFNIDIVEYIRKYFPDYISYCKNCGKICWYSKTLTKKAEVSGRMFCDHNCYWEYKINNPEEYEQSEETKKKFSKSFKETIRSGKYIPNNGFKGKPIKYKNMFFRSSWECLFFISKDEKILFEDLRIYYFDTQKNKNRIYIVDFIDYTNKLVYEIKPSCYNKDINVKDKERALIIWCNKNNYKYEIINEDYFNNLDISYYYKTPKEIRKNVRQFFETI